MTTRSHLRFFNTTGPCNPERHYMLPPAERVRGMRPEDCVRDRCYWMLQAPRQTGKSTFLLEWMREIHETTGAIVCYVNLGYSGGHTYPAKALPDISEDVNNIPELSRFSEDPIVPKGPKSAFHLLTKWASAVAPAPLVVLFAETEALGDEALLALVNQLREGYPTRALGVFPVSVGLVGRVDLAEYLSLIEPVAPPEDAPFSAKDGTARLGFFSPKDVARLFAQRTAEVGQQITQEALDYVYAQSHGQPWIVNNLFKCATMRVLKEDSTDTVTIEHVRAAREYLVSKKNTTHIEGLFYRMRDSDMRSFLEPLFLDTLEVTKPLSRAVCVWRDLGFLEASPGGTFVFANPIYEEVFFRHMKVRFACCFPPRDDYRWRAANGDFDMDLVLRVFQDFWCEDSERWEKDSDCGETYPHLFLMGFLLCITCEEARIDREYAVGRKRLVLLVEYKSKRYVIEIKLLRDHDAAETIREEGLAQIRTYRDTAAPEAPAYLVIFDRRTSAQQLPWDDRIKWETISDTTPSLAVLGC